MKRIFKIPNKFPPDVARTLAFIFIGNLFYGFSAGMNVTILPLFFSSEGLNKSSIGLLTALELAPIFAVVPFLHKLTYRLGVWKVILISAIFRNVSMALIPWVDDYYMWCVLMFMAGAGGYTLYVTMQFWVTSSCSDQNRGFGIATVNFSFSIGMALGPVIARRIGLSGWHPFFASSVIAFMALAPYFLVSDTLPSKLRGPTEKIRSIVKKSRRLIASGMYADYIYFSLINFLVLFGVNVGLTEVKASYLISYMLIGGIIIDLPVGLMVDKVNKYLLMTISPFIAVIAVQFLPLIPQLGHFTPLIFIFIAFSIGIAFVCPLSIMGERFKESELISANSIFFMMNCFGGIFGLVITGTLMDYFGPKGLIISLSFASFIYLIASLLMNKRDKKLNIQV